MSNTLDDVLNQIAAVKAVVDQIDPAVKNLEAQLASALANTGMSAADQAKVDQAMTALKDVATSASTALTDASPAPAPAPTNPPPAA